MIIVWLISRGKSREAVSSCASLVFPSFRNVKKIRIFLAYPELLKLFLSRCLMPFTLTRQAYWLMHTNHFTTFRTNPFYLFISSELPDSNLVDHFEIFDHAHSIFGSVSLIQLPQPGARESVTVIRAKSCFSFGYLFAVSDFACGTVFRFLAFPVFVSKTTRTCVFFSNKSPTEAAVHSTWCNQICRNCCRLFLMFFCHDQNV